MKTYLQISQISIDEFMGMFDEKINQAIDKLKEGYHSQNDSKELLTRPETANMLNVSLTTLHNWAKEQILVPNRIGKRVYYNRADVLSKLTK